MDTNFIKLLGKANIPEPLEIDKTYEVIMQADVTDVKRSSNHNGEYDVTFIAKPLSIEIVKQTGDRIKAKDPSSNSQKIRMRLFGCYMREGCVEDFDKVYDSFTEIVMSMTPALMSEAIKKISK